MKTTAKMALAFLLPVLAVCSGCSGCTEYSKAVDAGPGDAADGSGDAGDGLDAGGVDAGDGAGPADGDNPADGRDGSGDPGDGATDGGDGDRDFPRLGVYAIDLDGSDLELLLDAGKRSVTHVRRLPGTPWLTGTRYNKDPDGNGLAMEGEAGFGAYYDQTEVIVFDRRTPESVHVIAGGVDGRLCANSSWTDDGRLIYIHQDHPDDPNWTRLKRARFSEVPEVAAIEPIALPQQLLLPVDPHQVGPSNGDGSLVFTALVHIPAGWVRPVWRAPAGGAQDMQQVELVGCPICPQQDGCCAFPTLAEVLGTNDARINHAGTAVNWMQQHPDRFVELGDQTIHPWRQHLRRFGEPAVQLPAEGVAPATSLAFGAWSPDDSRLAYWAIEIAGGVVKNRLYTMTPDGRNRTRVPHPDRLCADHPSFIGPDRLVFTAWRCGTNCSCSPQHL
jgi:hypothetical protein